MTTDFPNDPNLPPPPSSEAQPLSPADERVWAMLAHLSVLLNLVTAFLGTVAPLVIYLAYKDRSRYVAYQAFQAFIFQLVWWVGGGVLVGVVWALTGILASFVVGVICIPFACLFTLAPVAALGYGILGGIECSQGRDFRYWLVGDWVEKTLTGQV
jgi:uncharacterized Tic20 family protein